jgi:plasmid stabilization system protein ParE
VKAYRVVFEANVLEDAFEAADYIASKSKARSDAWFEGLRNAVASLTSMPTRCGFARENKDVGEPLRQFIYHSHRIVFQVDEEMAVVRILFIRHAAMRPLDSIDDES